MSEDSETKLSPVKTLLKSNILLSLKTNVLHFDKMFSRVGQFTNEKFRVLKKRDDLLNDSPQKMQIKLCSVPPISPPAKNSVSGIIRV